MNTFPQVRGGAGWYDYPDRRAPAAFLAVRSQGSRHLRSDRKGRDHIMGHPTQGQLPISEVLADQLAWIIKKQIAVQKPGGCWIRSGRKPTLNGYTNITKTVAGKRRYYYAHRVMYVAAKGPIPDGLTIDHLCNNRACCNPKHLQAVPQHVNAFRGEKNYYAINARKTHCLRGHELPPHVLGGKRACQACRTIRRHAKNALPARPGGDAK